MSDSNRSPGNSQITESRKFMWTFYSHSIYLQLNISLKSFSQTFNLTDLNGLIICTTNWGVGYWYATVCKKDLWIFIDYHIIKRTVYVNWLCNVLSSCLGMWGLRSSIDNESQAGKEGFKGAQQKKRCMCTMALEQISPGSCHTSPKKKTKQKNQTERSIGINWGGESREGH
jgi:hypothetical protein